MARHAHQQQAQRRAPRHNACGCLWRIYEGAHGGQRVLGKNLRVLNKGRIVVKDTLKTVFDVEFDS